MAGVLDPDELAIAVGAAMATSEAATTATALVAAALDRDTRDGLGIRALLDWTWTGSKSNHPRVVPAEATARPIEICLFLSNLCQKRLEIGHLPELSAARTVVQGVDGFADREPSRVLDVELRRVRCRRVGTGEREPHVVRHVVEVVLHDRVRLGRKAD